MAFVPIPDTAKCAFIHNRAGPSLVNVFYFRRTGNWGLQELTDLAVALRDAWRTNVMPQLHQGVQFLRVEARGMRAQEDISVNVSPLQPSFGGKTADMLPGNVAFAVTHITGLTGRSNRGRTYFGGFAEDQVSYDVISQATADALVGALFALNNAAQSLGWTHVVASLYNNKQRRATGVTIPVISYRYADRAVDSQRRRLSGRGS